MELQNKKVEKKNQKKLWKYTNDYDNIHYQSEDYYQ